jgi:patatin-like phospholipase/acyl hydrolase
MAELFDLVAGTSTGSLLTTAIVLPNNSTDDAFKKRQRNMYFAENAT